MQRAVHAILLDLNEADGVAKIILNRPEKRNAMNQGIVLGVMAALEEIRANDRIGCILTMAAGGIAFSAGMDLFEMRDHHAHPEKYPDWLDITIMHETIRTFPKVTVAVVDGFCLGGGMTLVASHDLAIASDTAEFGLPEVIRGSYATNATPVLQKHIPLKKLFYLNLTGRSLDAEEAERAGLISKVVPKEELQNFAYTLAKEVAGHSLTAMQFGKEVSYASRDMNYQDAWQYSRRRSQELHQVADPLTDVEGYLKSQKRGTDSYEGIGYRRPEDR